MNDLISLGIIYLEENGVPNKEAQDFINLIYQNVQSENLDEKVFKELIYQQTASYLLAREEGQEDKIVHETKEFILYYDSEFFSEAQSALQEKKSLIFENRVKEGAYTCPRCKSKKMTIQTVQDRSADEGSSNYIICSDCGLKLPK